MKSFGRVLLVLSLLAWIVRAAFVWQVRDTLAERADDPFLQGAPAVTAAEAISMDGQRSYGLKYITDMSTYVRIARMVLAGDLLAENVTISPLAPLVVLPLLLGLAKGNLAAAMVLQGFLGSLQVLLTGLVGRRYVGDGGALLAAAAAALYSTFIIYDSLPLTEATINVAVLFAFLSFLRLREKPSGFRAAVLGAALGLAMAAKPTLALLPPLMVVAEMVERRPGSLGRMVPLLAVSFAVAGLVTLPFIVRARMLSGEWLFIRANTGYAVLMGNNPHATGFYSEPAGEYGRRFEEAVGDGPGRTSRRERVALAWALDFWRQDTAAAAGLFWRKLLYYLSPFEVPNNVSTVLYRQLSFLRWPVFPTSAVLWPFALLGAAVVLPGARRWTLPVLFVLSYSAMIVATFVVARLRLPVVPFMMIAAGGGVVWLAGRDRARFVRAAVLSTLLLAAAYGHRNDLRRMAVPLVRPSGLPASMEEGTLYRDGNWTDRAGAPYGASISDPRGSLVKEIILPRGVAESALKAAVVFRGGSRGEGNISLEVNGFAAAMALPPGEDGEATLFRIPVEPEWLREKNRIVIRVFEGTALRIRLDDEYRYGRSFLSRAGEPPAGERLDMTTFQTSRFAHIPRGELEAGILVVPR